MFQLESDGMKKLLAKLQPDRFEDIIAVLALYRPGPLGSGMVDDFILRKKGQQKIDYFHDDLKACLTPTYGVIVYQEQVMQISQIIGGYTLGGADMLRRAMGKKKAEEMAKHRAIFSKGAEEKGYGAALAMRLFDLMEKFAEYGFNKSHTAAYAVVSYQTAWLKAHHTSAFMAATLSSELDNTDQLKVFYEDTLANKVKVLGPDINVSNYRFEPVSRTEIRYGLGAVKGTGEQAVESIVAERKAGGPFRDLFDFCRRVDKRIVNRRTIEALVCAGAFDAITDHRASLLASVGLAMESAEQHNRSLNQASLFGEETRGRLGRKPGGCAALGRWRSACSTKRKAWASISAAIPTMRYRKELSAFIRTKLADLGAAAAADPDGGRDLRHPHPDDAARQDGLRHPGRRQRTPGRCGIQRNDRRPPRSAQGRPVADRRRQGQQGRLLRRLPRRGGQADGPHRRRAPASPRPCGSTATAQAMPRR